MAARWGAGEEILSACNMEFFSTNTLDEVKYTYLNSRYVTFLKERHVNVHSVRGPVHVFYMLARMRLEK